MAILWSRKPWFKCSECEVGGEPGEEREEEGGGGEGREGDGRGRRREKLRRKEGGMVVDRLGVGWRTSGACWWPDALQHSCLDSRAPPGNAIVPLRSPQTRAPSCAPNPHGEETMKHSPGTCEGGCAPSWDPGPPPFEGLC